MFKISFEDPKENESPNDIALHNMRQADENLDLNCFIAGSTGWLNANVGKGYQDLEKFLRLNNFDTHLFPKKIVLPKSKKLGVVTIKNDQTVYEYEVIISCRPKEDAIAEILTFWPSYEESFKNLSKAGCVLQNSDKVKEDLTKEYKILDDTDADYLGQVCQNKKKISFSFISVKQVMHDTEARIKKNYGKSPELKLVAMGHSGGPIMGFCVNNQIVDEVGILIEHNEKGEKVMSLVEIRLQ